MTKIVCTLCLLLSYSISHAAENVLTPEQIDDGWIALFDGETHFGWQATSDANWRVEDGTITVDSGDEGWLMSTSEFADYELHVEFQAPETTNGGVFLHSPQSDGPGTGLLRSEHRSCGESVSDCFDRGA